MFGREIEQNAERWVFLQELDTECSPEELDKNVELITEVMRIITKKTAKEKAFRQGQTMVDKESGRSKCEEDTTP